MWKIFCQNSNISKVSDELWEVATNRTFAVRVQWQSTMLQQNSANVSSTSCYGYSQKKQISFLYTDWKVNLVLFDLLIDLNVIKLKFYRSWKFLHFDHFLKQMHHLLRNIDRLPFSSLLRRQSMVGVCSASGDCTSRWVAFQSPVERTYTLSDQCRWGSRYGWSAKT